MIAGIGQLLTALNPLNQYALAHVLDDTAPIFPYYPWLFGGMIGLGISFALLWWWAACAPFRAALTALVLYLVFYATVALGLPQLALDSITSKILVLIGLLLAVRAGWLRQRVS